MLAATRRNLAPGFEDRWALLRRNLHKHYRIRPSALDTSLPSRRAYVLHPLRTIPEHRHKIPLTVIVGDDENGFVEAISASVLHLQRKQDSRG